MPRSIRIVAVLRLLPLVCPLFGLCPAARAQTASLVQDIATRETVVASRPEQLRVVGGKLFFIAEGQEEGQLWVTDGSAANTELLADFCPLSCFAEPAILGSAGKVLFVAARDEDVFGFRLWRSDGTRAGTFPLTGREVLPRFDDGAAVAGGTIYFRGCDEEAGCELWASDGTPAGTRRVADVVPGEESSDPTSFAPLGNRVFFYDNPGDLWRSDGTAAGTARVADLPPRLTEVPVLVAAGSRVFFFATGASGPELWASDGTAAGTFPVTRFASQDPFEEFWLRPLGGRVYFRADDGSQGEELWVSDGTVAGTRRVTGFADPRPFAGGLSPFEVEELGGKVIFYAADGAFPRTLWSSAGAPAATTPLCRQGECPSLTRSFRRPGLVKTGRRLVFAGADPGHGFEPWSTDGTVAGTFRLQDLCPGPCDGLPGQPVPLAGAAFFTASPGGEQGELWRTDGTRQGTRRFADRGPRTGFDLEVAALGSTVFFPAGEASTGIELWASDGRPGGTRLVADLGRFAAGSFLREMVALGGTALFTACSADGAQVWRSGGPASTAALSPATAVAQCVLEDSPRDLTVAGSLAFFTFRQPRSQLWRTDGTPAGTLLLVEMPEGSQISLHTLAALGARLVFAVEGDDGFALWVSDGSPAGTRPFFDLPGRPIESRGAGSEVYFSLGQSGLSTLWRTDGTAGGTRQIGGESLTFPGQAFHWTRLGPAVLFFALEDTGYRLWRTDGTPAGTSRIGPVPLDFGPSRLVELGGALYFLATELGDPPGADSGGLWRTDGTPAGTRLVRAFPRVTDRLAVAAGRVFFVARDQAHGFELWQSDGTPEGTALVRDLLPGSESSLPGELTAASGRLFFAARDRFHGIELWQSDGTEAGTRLVEDLHPGAASAEPEALTVAGDRLFFAADDGVAGREPWVLPLAAGPGCQPSTSRLCLNGGRFQVEIAWQDFGGRKGAGTAVPLTADTGYFWFFDAANVELVVKVLDAQPLNGHFWVFYGALSSVEYTLTVTDTQTGAARRYLNPAGQLASVGDTRAFGSLGAFSQTPAPVASPLVLVAERQGLAVTAPCSPGPRRLCLQGGRFAVEALWKDFQGVAGFGTAVGLTADTGYFWFFDAANVEVVLKVLDGRGLNGKFWVFYGALSNVEYTLTVTDTETGTVRTYANPSGRFASGADTGAF